MSRGIELIKETIRKRVEDETQKILFDAEEEAKRIVEEAREEAESRLMRVVKPEVTIIRRKILGSATSEGRRIVMESREEIIKEVFERVTDRFKEIVKGKELDYEEILYSMIKEAAIKIGEDKLIINGNGDGLRYLYKNLGTIEKKLESDLGHMVKLEAAKDPYDCIGGVVAYNEDGTRIYYNTLDGRLLRLREKLRWELTKRLFG